MKRSNRPSGMSKRQRARYYRQWRKDKGAIPRDYDDVGQRAIIHPESLANLAIGRDRKAADASHRRNTIRRLMVQGRSVADIVLLTGYSRAGVYRLMGGVTHMVGSADGYPLCETPSVDLTTTARASKVTCVHCRKRLRIAPRDPLLD